MDRPRHLLATYLVISDDAAFRLHLRQAMAGLVTDACLLADVGLASSPLLARQLQPDLTLIDLENQSASELLHLLGAAAPEARHLLFAVRWDDAAMIRVLAAGGHGCLLRDAAGETCLRAVRAIIAGDLWVPRSALTGALTLLNQRLTGSTHPDALTGREREVAEAACRGLDNKQIARELGMSPATVKTHLHHIFAKLGTTRRRLLMEGLAPP